MRAVIQRVQEASVTINGQQEGAIGKGLLLLVGFEPEDTQEDLEWMARKVSQLRIFNDEEGLMNLDIHDVEGELLVVSQFTLHAKTKKGNRPSYIRAAKPDIAIPLYESFVEALGLMTGKPIQTGEFGADMKVTLVNNGPVTLWIDTKNKE